LQFPTGEPNDSLLGTEEGTDEPRAVSSHRRVLPGGMLPAPTATHVTDTQTDRVVYFPMTLIPGTDGRVEHMGFDMISLLLMYGHVYPEALDTRGQIPPRQPNQYGAGYFSQKVTVGSTEDCWDDCCDL
jgi:hypothetical protein